jgi:hypothetical protein
MSAVDDSIAKIIADKNAALKEAALWKAEAERWRQIALEQSHENRTDRKIDSAELNSASSQGGLF